MPKIRNSAKAVIIRDGSILLQCNRDALGEYWLLPGGGQKHGEALHDALRREVLEETGLEITPGPLLHVREYIGARHEFAELDAGVHQVEFMFRCEAVPGSSVASPAGPDDNQVGVEWVDIADLAELPVYPGVLKELLAAGEPYAGPVYLGAVN
ncbi:MAG: NUDIX domain-containing protein [Planctomycetes bacterium]|nr:NUDIX domain-containing protein [Planctomycetota bacterium]